jgi:hypothetical protein
MEGEYKMKYLIAFILLLLLAVPLFSHAQDKPLCEQYVCVAEFNYGYKFGFGGGGGSGPAGSGIQLETADFLLAETGDFLILE